MDELLSTGQLACRLMILAHRIEYTHVAGHLPEPIGRFLGKRMYTSEDVRLVQDYFQVSGRTKTATEEQ